MTPRSAASEAPADEDQTPPVDPPAAGTAAPETSSSETAFFAWIRGLGLERRTGWLGGVCAGVADRVGLDPILVRGIVVVLAVIGAPVVLLYAIAWALLPDENGVIHVQELLRGTVTRALPGIVALFLLSFLPVTQGFWHVGALYFDDIGWGGAIARAAWTGVVLIAAIVLVVWLARRASGEPVQVPATTDDRPETVPAAPAAAVPGAGTAALADAAAPRAIVPDPGAEPPRPVDASDEELAEWKRQQEEWKRQRAEWAAEQRRTERERRQAEAHERAVEAADASRERARIRRLTNPRAGAGVVFLVLGVGVVAAAVATLLGSQTRGLAGTASAAWIIGAATLVGVLGLGTVIVALCRRRSGGLAFFSTIAVLLLAFTVVVPSDRQLLLGGGSSLDNPGRYAQFNGSTHVFVEDLGGAARVIDLWQFSGGIGIELDEGATVRIDATSDSGHLSLILEEWFDDESYQYSFFGDGDGRASVTIGEGDPDVILKLWTRHAGIQVYPHLTASSALPVDPAPGHVDRHSWDGDSLKPLLPGEDVASENQASPPQPAPQPAPESTESAEGVAP
ncbi:PspC domain-containing protein [Salinibacterium sp. ZJ70]|uniref:PspC domain-containing protein n=1 Tax=Salinibacterium sp. ZJ70 TaxID=2708084 RepID=UPI00141EA2AA|nr:PspC domain-containing protein [Salinibacterium sp. ZJ70]